MRTEPRRRKLTPGVEEMEARDVPSAVAGQMFGAFMAARQMQLQAMRFAALANRFAHVSSPNIINITPFQFNNMLNGHLMPIDPAVRATTALSPVVAAEPQSFIGPFIPGQPPQIHGPITPLTIVLR